MTHSTDLTDFISIVPLFANLRREELETAAAYIDRRRLEPGGDIMLPLG